MAIASLRGRYLLDTNLLIYATLEGDPRHPRALETIERGQESFCEAFVSVQNLAEMYPNLTGPKTQPPDAPAVARAKIASISRLHYLEVLPVTPEIVSRALEVCERYNVRRQAYFDMQLVATMLVHAIPTLATENTKDFSFVPDIVAVNPFES
jgi:predicted nucleic acid-binding protein